MSQRVIYWFRNDLRLFDNEGFSAAVAKSDVVIPVYVFDPRQFAKTKFGFRRSGALRAQFLINTIAALRERLREKGSDLIIRIGEPEKVIAELAEQSGASHVYSSKEIAPDETRVESSLSKNLKLVNIDIKLFWMNTLINTGELPFPISKLPKTFDAFYEQMKFHLGNISTIPEPEKLAPPADHASGSLPSLPALGIDPLELGGRSATLEMKPGELQAKRDLNEFASARSAGARVASADPLMQTGLSKWLSAGCLSSRDILNTVCKKEMDEEIVRALLKRDYSQWNLLKYGPRLFKPSGIIHDFKRHWNNDPVGFAHWRNAETDSEEVNGLIKKLNETGYLTFDERVKASDYLSNVLNVNWTWGAMYFESFLIDYSVSNSWCNWNSVAGVDGSIS